MIIRGVLLLAFALLGCAPASSTVADPSTPAQPSAQVVSDPHSHALPRQVRVRHLGADWTVDFDARRLHGAVTLWVDRVDAAAPLRLDTRALRIEAVRVGTRPGGLGSDAALAEVGDEAAWSETPWSLADADPILGQGLTVELPPGVDLVRIEYSTTDASTGLQWLEPGQTADGTHPFLYSQSQAIHARSWIPCQDTPGVRTTYDAVVHTGAGLQPLMSADRVLDPSSSTAHRFSMGQAVPSYLIALAVGHLEFEPLGGRSGVWAEPSTLRNAVAEFADVERMMAAAESLYGPYRWGRYDILVLPPAFPFGGMENPKLTFATPTILAGDRSLVALIAHELAHSWSGNLVTNAAWSDIWLNEGFTVYIERRVVEALYGRERAQMEAMLGRQDLDRALGELSAGDQRLVVDLRGRDPDDGLNDIPYEKGALFLEMLEETYGRDRFDRFLLGWFDAHAFSSVTTAQFEQFLQSELVGPGEPVAGHSMPAVNTWIHEPGIGPNAPKATSGAFARVDDAVASFVGGTPAQRLPIGSWTAHEWLHFLRAIPSDLAVDRLADLDRSHGLTESRNAEIVAQWLQVAIRNGYRAADQRLEAFLLSVGRRKFLLPLYRRLLESERADEARAIYARARAGYHPITQQSLDALLGA